MPLFSARKRPNPFADRRRQRAQQAAETVPAPAPVPEEPADAPAPQEPVQPEPEPEAAVVPEPEPEAEPITSANGSSGGSVIAMSSPHVSAELPTPGEPEPADDVPPTRKRGRPRPQETIDRDNAVHALLVSADSQLGIPKEAIAVDLGEKEQQVYSSLRQLTKEGRAESRYVKDIGYRWFAV